MLEKAYKHGALKKGNINKRGYNKFLSMDGEVKVAINYDHIAEDSKWDGLKGYPDFVIVSPKNLRQRVWRFSDVLPSALFGCKPPCSEVA